MLIVIIRIPYVGLIDLNIIITVGDVNLDNLIYPSCIDGLLGEDVGLKCYKPQIPDFWSCDCNK